MVQPDLWLKAGAAVASAAFGLALLAAGRRRAPALFLGAFLLLIAGNQAAEAARVVVAGDPAPTLVLFRVATVFAALDPFFLYAFAATWPAPNALRRPWAIAAAFVPAASLALAATVMAPEEWGTSTTFALQLAWAAYTAIVYGVVLARVLALARTPGSGASAVLLAAGVAVAALPTFPRVAYYAGRWWESTGGTPPPALVPVLVAVASLALLAAARRRAVAAAIAAGAALAVVVQGAGVGVLLGLPLPGVRALYWMGAGGAALRWLAFGVLVSMAVLRHHMLGLSVAARRGAARVLVALAFLAVGLAPLAWLARSLEGSPALAPVQIGLVLVALVASQRLRRLVDRTAEIVYGVPMPGDLAASLDAYRRAVQEASVEGRSEARDAELARLRAELGLDDRSAAVVARMAEAATSEPLGPGVVLAGRYRVARAIGRGSSGRAFLARDEATGADVVLKEVWDDRGGEEAALAEARMAGAVAHANVVPVLDVVRRGATSVLVAEHVPGGSLEDRLAAGALAPGEALRLVEGVLAGLAAVHAAGVVHRDLKPANVLLAADGAPRIADFGLARLDAGATARPGDAFAGTPAWMAPEQRRGEAATFATDVHAVGLLARRLGGLPPAADAVVARALEPEPAARWRDAGEMRAALATALAVTPGT